MHSYQLRGLIFWAVASFFEGVGGIGELTLKT